MAAGTPRGPVETRLVKQGNSAGVTLTREVLEAAGMARDEVVSITAIKGRIVLDQVDSKHSRVMAAYASGIARSGTFASTATNGWCSWRRSR